MFIEIVLFIILCFVAFNYYVRHGRVANYLDRLPGPYAPPIFGTMHLTYKSPEKVWPALNRECLRHYPLWRGWAPHRGVCSILDPENLEIILSSTKHITKSELYTPLKPWLKDGLLLSKGEKWQHRRRTLTPAFHFFVLRKYMDSMNEHGQKLVQFLKKENKEVTIELIPFITKYTLSLICETAMGTSLGDEKGVIADEYRDAVHEMGRNVIYRIINPWFIPLNFLFNWCTIRGWKQNKFLKTLHNFSSRIIEERKKFHNRTNGEYLKQFENMTYKEQEDDIIHMKSKNNKKMAMLDLLIATQRKGLIDDEGIREEVDTFIFEGHDTVAMALTYIIQLLGQYTDVQEKVRDEINKTWESCNGNITMNILQKLSYTDRVLKEILRLYPSVPFISRYLEEDLQLKKYIIPRGTVVTLFVYDIHRHPKNWPDPDKFDPDRFLPENLEKRHPFSYIPFSAGPRNCIGQKFAMQEIKIFLIYLLRDFRIEAMQKHEEFRRSLDIILRPIDKIYVKFIPIQR